MVDLDNKGLNFLREKLNQGDYDGTDLMKAWIAIDELIELRQFRDKAFKVHPNIDMDIENNDDPDVKGADPEGLLPCPFCGSAAEFEYTDYDHETGEGDDGMGYAQCTNKRCGIGFFDDRSAAIEKWNRRI